MNIYFSMFGIKGFGRFTSAKTFFQKLKVKEKRDSYLPQYSKKANTVSCKGIVSRSNYRLYCNRRR